MSIRAQTFKSVAWSMASSWVQLAVGLATFGFVARWLGPSDIGAFGVFALCVGVADVIASAPWCDSLKQRKSLKGDHINATLVFTFGLNAIAVFALVGGRHFIADAFSAPAAASLLLWAALLLPLNAVSNVVDAMLARDMRFDVMSRYGAISSIISGLVTIGCLVSGLGVWSLLAANIASQGVYLAGAWRASRYAPHWPKDFAVLRDLSRFNRNSLTNYLLGFGDGIAPRIATGAILGAEALGYYIVANRIFGLVWSLVLSPIGSIAFSAVARVQDDKAELRRVVASFYRLASFTGYPAFLGMIVILPDLAQLAGQKWQAAVLVAQILLLNALRQTTGMFNMAILRGVDRSDEANTLLGLGLLLNAILAPLGAAIWGVYGVALAMLLRTFATWPMGSVFIKRATGMTYIAQAKAGLDALVAATVMAALTCALLSWVPDQGSTARVVAGVAFGASAYLAMILAWNWRTLSPLIARLRRDGGHAALRNLKQALQV